MIYLYIISGFILTIINIIFSYLSSWKNSIFYYPIGITVALIVNLLWFKIAREVLDNNSLYRYGVVWDVLIALSWLLIPVLFFGIKLTKTNVTGLVLLVIGIVMIHLKG